MQALAAVLVVLAVSSCAGTPPPTAKHGEFAAEVLMVGGTKREYRLFVPTSVDLARPAPLVVAFHAMLIDSKDVMPTYTGLNETAQRHGFVIAYPNANGASYSALLGLEALGGVNAARKFPVLIVHGTFDLIFPYRLARENANTYRREGHEVNYIEIPGLAHAWARDANVNEQIWAFFDAHRRTN
jgi:poly(3-hydroxybutyrate) depolymerase